MSKKIVLSEGLAKEIYSFYSQGNSLKDCEIKFGIHREKISRELKKHGFVLRFFASGMRPHNLRSDLPVNEICESYVAGESENSIARDHNVSRNVVRRILLEREIPIRTRSEAELLKWSKMTQDERKSQVKEAHKSLLGRARTDEQKRKTAIAREKNTPSWYIGCGEPEFATWLENNKIEFKYQKAVEFYNIDFLIGNTAVELTSFVGRNRTSRLEFLNRAKVLNDQGIRTIAVEFRDKEELIKNADYVIKIVKMLNSGYKSSNHYFLVRLQTINPSLEILV